MTVSSSTVEVPNNAERPAGTGGSPPTAAAAYPQGGNPEEV